jgi:hypothetical protein
MPGLIVDGVYTPWTQTGEIRVKLTMDVHTLTSLVMAVWDLYETHDIEQYTYTFVDYLSPMFFAFFDAYSLTLTKPSLCPP